MKSRSNRNKSGYKMDKKVVIFFALFALVMLGGSCALSYWVLPKYLTYHNRDIRTGRVRSQLTEAIPLSGQNPRTKTDLKGILIITQSAIVVGAIYIILFVGARLRRKFGEDRPINMPSYLFKISRLTGKSEYDVFYKAAQEWPVSREQIEQDFKKYLSDESIPYYVNDFVRKNKKHIDELRVSIFSRSWYKGDI